MPDFGSFRGFGEKLVQGQTPTQLGKIGSESAYDGDANAFFIRVSGAGGSLSNTEKFAINQLVTDLKANSLWTPMKAIYPMVGASAEACKQNLKSSSFTGTFTSGWTFASTGVTGNGTSAYFDSNCLVNTNLSPTNYGGGFYKRNNTPTLDPDFGAMSASFNIYSNYDGNTTYHRGINADPDRYTNTSSNGFFHQYGKSSASTAFNRGVLKLTGGSGNISGTNSVCLAGNVAAGYTDSQYAFMFLSEALTDTQASNLYTAVQAFQTTLSRQV
jgi:hypothetical protein